MPRLFDSFIKKRQLFDDLKFMESESGWSIPLKRFKEGRKTYSSGEIYSLSQYRTPEEMLKIFGEPDR